MGEGWYGKPSLILIMLGVAMMLTPKFMPQKIKEAGLTENMPVASSKPELAAAVAPPATDQPPFHRTVSRYRSHADARAIAQDIYPSTTSRDGQCCSH
ncbi:MAG: hypothetical protein PVI92_17230 [Chromatiales bacterium]|jgi:hypothetical protein